MEYVEPIKDIETLNEIKAILKQRSIRDYVLFVVGINTGILASQLLKIKVRDVYEDEKVKEFYSIEEHKNGEMKKTYLNSNVKNALIEYITQNELEEGDYLFKSKKNNEPITRQQAYRIINNVAREVGITEKIGTHTLRKTFGYHAYIKGVAVSFLQSIFNHATPAETLRYIGIDKTTCVVKIDVNL